MRWLAPLLGAAAVVLAPAAQAATLGFDRRDAVCRATIHGFRVAWTETAYSRNQVQGSDGSCATKPPYITAVGRSLGVAARKAARLRLTIPRLQTIAVLDVRGPTGRYTFTTGNRDGTSRIALDIYLQPTEQRASIARQLGYAIENRTVPDVFRRLPPWVVQGIAGWFELAVAPSAADGLTSELAVLGGAGTATAVTGLSRPATAFWTVATGRAVGAPAVRAVLRRAGARTGRATTRVLVGDLAAAFGATHLATAMGGYAAALATGQAVGGIPLPTGFRAGRAPAITATSAGAYDLRTVTLPPLGAAIVPVTWAAAPGLVTVTLEAGDVRAARSLAASCTVIGSGTPGQAGARHGTTISWTLDAAAGSAEVVLASALARQTSVEVHAVAAPSG